ncbi:hypothetical protein GCM10023185_07690 [Hymenobacter saemangeumensis]|uniref:Outer membrane protein beta-barrel domain-containing protein n=1 Tax=Hymenobacter saemangeumensis TaxID=1084522 RepID=A0ABP8I2R8_9BACT
MATPNFWHQLHLHRPQLKRLAVLGIFVAGLFPGTAHAQREAERSRKGKVTGITVNNLPAYDDRWFHPGLYLAFSGTRFMLEQSQYYIDTKQVTANSIVSPSFGVGLIGDARLGGPKSPFILRFAPGVLFSSRRVEFESSGYPAPDSVVTQEITSTVLQFPVLLKYQSDRRRNTRAYMIAGISPNLTVGNRRDDGLRNVLRVTDSDLTIEYGVGLDLFYPLFKFAPELRFSHGLGNILINRSDIFSRSLQSLRTNAVTLYINIQN